MVPRVHTKQGESAFSYYAARSWNQLPEEIRCAKTLATFKSKLICLVLLLLNEHCATSELISLCKIVFLFLTVLNNCFNFYGIFIVAINVNIF